MSLTNLYVSNGPEPVCIDPIEHGIAKPANRERTDDETIIHWFKVIGKTYGVCFEASEL